jgi:nitric-oxide synthase
MATVGSVLDRVLPGGFGVDTKTASDPLRRRLRRLSGAERREEAVAFLRRFHAENGLPAAALRDRQREVIASLARHGHYDHTPEELGFGARLAWRNHARCIGRRLWKSLEVVDCRHVVAPDDMAGRIVDHMRSALGDGRIRSIITIFAPVRGDALPNIVESPQITRYAGYVAQDRVIGDPDGVTATRNAIALGWRPPEEPGDFDLLPFIIREPGGRRRIYETPADAVREIPIVHPRFPGLGALGLRWYAVPCVSDMILTIGGVDYPCCPFNGYYLCTEIASRNLTDKRRYDLLERIADALGEPRRAEALWRDRALVAVNEAVLHSFRGAGVSVDDHHAASDDYVEFMRRERAEGREASGDWAWIVPPQASSACEVFHLAMRDMAMVPNFYRDRATDGAALAPNYDDEEHGRTWWRWLRWRRRLQRWRRRVG